ncbi:MAG: hypothetical protein AABZ55_05375 [Bdellovibrionota bacterium]
MSKAEFQYHELRSLIESGLYEAASDKIRVVRDESSPSRDLNILRSLISARISLNSVANQVDESALNPALAERPWVRAEVLFVRGLLRFQLNEFSSGIEDFLNAENLYRTLHLGDREVLSGFNAFIGKLNAGLYPDSSIGLECLKAVERRATELGCRKVLGMIFRQKSYFLQSLGRSRAALQEVARGFQDLEFYAPKADYQLARIQAADCALDLALTEDTILHLEFVVPPLEARVQFPLAYVQSRRDKSPLTESALRSFEVIAPFWLSKWKTSKGEEKKSHAKWSKLKGELQLPAGRTIPVQHNNLEGKLIQLLIQSGSSKTLICEKLWPESCSVGHLDNRLHRLVSRLNTKSGMSLVQFDGKLYHLALNVQFTD